MPRFCAVFSSSSRVNREKDKTNLFTVFPKLLKIMVMKGKVRREKWLAQVFMTYLTERKLKRTRTRIKIMFSASPSLAFAYRVLNTKLEKQARILS